MLLMVVAINAQNYKTESNISYTTKTDAYSKERLKLDVYYPEKLTDCPVIVWFHGGGLEAGQKEIPQRLKEKGYVVIGANYRLLPKVTIDKTIDDAAEAVAWAFGLKTIRLMLTVFGNIFHSAVRLLLIIMYVRCRVSSLCSQL